MGFRNREDLERRSGELAQFCYLGDGIGVCRVLGEFKMFVNTNDLSLAPHLMMDGCWESWVSIAVSRIVQPGMVCIDVGANFGYYTLLMGALAGPNGGVWAIEPNDDMCTLLGDTVNINGMDQWVSIISGAAWNNDHKKLLIDNHGSEELMGSISVREPTIDLVTTDDLVGSITIDRLVGDNKIDFVKIDAEGAEPKILEGMVKTINNNPDIQILMEWSPDHDGFDEGFLNQIKSLFKVARVNSASRLETIMSIDQLHGLEMLLLRKGD